jgi:hypothetical protein
MDKSSYQSIAIMSMLFTALTIFIVSSMSFPQSTTTFGLALKPIVYHAGIFFFLQFFLLLSMKKNNEKTILLTLSISIVYAILDEIHQFFVPGRSMTIFDMAIDTIGILLATAIYTYRK